MPKQLAKSNRQLARTIGVSESAVRKAEKTGRIRREPDGNWDVAKVQAQWKANTNVAKKPVGSPELKRVPSVAVESLEATVKENRITGKGDAFMQARTANEVLKVHLNRLKLQEQKGELINRDKTLNQVFLLSRQYRDALQNWPARVSAQMAAELGVDQFQMHELLERYVHEFLEETSGNKVSID